ncbi:MAG: hypothetical protein HGA85_07005 [Nanoarchaeota archaeon]|nr:hypothetical protein [Nanoarchaeota archaeon]
MKKLIREEKALEKELAVMVSSEYGIKELIHGILIGTVIGFMLAWLLLK